MDLEDWEDDTLNPLTGYRSRNGDAPTASQGTPLAASDYQRTRLGPGISFDTYKRPTEIRKPRGEYDTDKLAPTALSASDYLRKKYGDFSGATEVVPKAAPLPPQTTIMGTEAITVGDLKILQNAVDSELLRLQSLRTVDIRKEIKQAQLDALGDNLSDVTGRVERGEIKVEDVAIFPATARQFLKTFRVSENLPELFDPNGNSPASMKPAPAAATATATATNATTAAATAASAPSTGPNFLQWLYKTVQTAKWSLDANYEVEQAKEREMRETLGDMEKRILAYSYGDTPMPVGYQDLFLQKINELQKELREK
jgi:hypothetical protein